MPFRLFLVRHGLTDWNEEGRLLGRIDIGLNARGRAQADDLARSFRGLPIARVVSSPQQRAQETARPIAEALGLSVETEAGVDEVWLRRWQGKKLEELKGDPDLERYRQDPTYECDAIESPQNVQKRMVDVVEHLRVGNRNESVILVSHGDPLRLVLAHYLSMELAAFRRLTADNASVSLLDWGRGRPRLIGLNWAPSMVSITCGKPS
jgi:broad specificity phosphatase PhoE